MYYMFCSVIYLTKGSVLKKKELRCAKSNRTSLTCLRSLVLVNILGLLLTSPSNCWISTMDYASARVGSHTRPLILNNAQARGHAGGRNDTMTYGRKMCGTQSGAVARPRWGNLASSELLHVSHSRALPPVIPSTVWGWMGWWVGGELAGCIYSKCIGWRSSSGNKFFKRGLGEGSTRPRFISGLRHKRT